jgi:hypothetical protein
VVGMGLGAVLDVMYRADIVFKIQGNYDVYSFKI